MYKLCVFAGTTEGRELVSFLCRQNVRVYACVATHYGGTLLDPHENLTVSAVRLTLEDMQTLLRRELFDLVVDATHPYARLVTENIVRACDACGTPYLRVARDASARSHDAVFVDTIAQAVEYLNGVDGNILLTTGSKQLHEFAPLRDFSERVYARVLPMQDSLRLCEAAGVRADHILAMQGPFSAELNAAMLRMTNAAYLVTKDTGKAGGFSEKLEAAQQTGATAVIIGRPPQPDGLSYEQAIAHLCARFDLTHRPQVAVIGIGPGDPEDMTVRARNAVSRARCILGAARMVEGVGTAAQRSVCAIAPQQIASYIAQNPFAGPFAVVMSGDIGFFSGAKKLLPLLSECDVQLFPGLSSLSCLCAALGTSYEDVVCVSAHGRTQSILPQVRRHARVFALVGGENGAGRLCAQLTEAGLPDARVSVGERLSYPDQKLTRGTAAELATMQFHDLSAVLIETAPASCLPACGLPDELFLRAPSVPMTKSEVRAVCLSRLALPQNAVVWDIGAGTGSVSVEMALQAPAGQVYAVECREDAISLLRENRLRFGADNITVVPGIAPQVCAELPAPTHAFIGGSGGSLRAVIDLLLAKNPHVRIVATAVSLETLAELTACMDRFAQSQVVSLSVARSRALGAYHLMNGKNPIWIFTMEGGKPECTPCSPS